MDQYANLIVIVLIIGVFYLMIIRPQQKRAQQQRDMIASLKVGDEIVTIGGIFATIVDVGERIRVRVADGTELELAKQAIGQVASSAGEVSGEGDSAEDEGESAEDA